MAFAIEPVTEDSLDAAVRCHIACLAEAYRHIVVPARLAEMTDFAMRRELWRARTAASSEPALIARDATGEVVGLAQAGPSRQDWADLPDRELYTLYVRSSTYGTGLGAELMRAAIGDTDAWLWVYRANDRARRFYGKHGFVPTGREQVRGADGAPEAQFVRSRSV